MAVTQHPSDSGDTVDSPAEPASEATGHRGAGRPERAAEQLVADPECAAAVELARAAAIENAEFESVVGETGQVGEHLGVSAEAEREVTHRFAAGLRGYQGWYWAVTVGRAEGYPPTIAEVVLLPGAGALLAPAWVPWSERIQAGDLSPGDVLPTPADDPRLAPAYLLSDDPQVEQVAFELGLGRVRVMSRFGRLDTADRWLAGDGGPDTPMARQAPGPCGTCGFFLPLAGSLQAAFGACANEVAETDGRIVSVDHGCGAHSEAVAEPHTDDLGVVYEDDPMDALELDHDSTEPAADLAEQPAVETDGVTVDGLDTPEPQGIDAEQQPVGALDEPQGSHADLPAAVEGGVEQPPPAHPGEDLV